MDSRNGSDPTDRNTRRRRSSVEIASEDQVAQQTEEVFQSYAFYRYQQEQEQTEGDVPHDPEIAAIQQEPNSTNCQVGRRLALIGDDINARYDKEFSDMLKSLQPTRDNAYEYFTRIATSQMALFLLFYHLYHQYTVVVSVLQSGKFSYSAFTFPFFLLFNVVVYVKSLRSLLCLLSSLQ
ncbi:bcl-2 homologous antagonist/killer isoform X2 [Sceloporus undulatus]|uniref:bcl-2 homologous antagonist/killer isoform X2 n=1 Tax=Sceloporus undulatus TaxID=8520 RepID=UPI001C4AA3BE|nr:bcl-2 homologous antagonist/killer isoform X2 [Sceloporus undulatus]